MGRESPKVFPMPRGTRTRRWGSTLLSTALLLGLLAVAGLFSTTLAPDRARTVPAASTSYLCTGYNPCRQAGYSDAGYGANNDKMYWRMYAGHNCTNYAAYRMIKAGMSTQRPWDSTGMAYNWGHARSDITNQTPRVGAIAWWDRYEGGIGSSGHVAYVERVVSSTEIIISEDSWSGDFHWRRVTKGSGRWPSGFIHFIDAKVVTNNRAPKITGTPQVGVKLTAKPGAWKPDDARLSYQWLADGVEIGGATRTTFTPTAEQRGDAISVAVTGKRRGYTPTTVTSAATDRVARGELAATTPPTVEGDPLVDETLSATPGTYTTAPDRIAYRWRADGTMIDGAYDDTLVLTRALLGKAISVSTVARKDGYVKEVDTSETVGPVVVGEIEVTEPFGIEGQPHLGTTLTATPGTYAPADATVAYQWLRDGAPIAGATASSYALVAGDLGAEISLQATLTRRNYAERVETVALEGAVTSEPTIAINANGYSHKAVVAVRVTAPDVVPVTGTVTVRIGQREVVGELVDGRVRVVVERLQPGDKLVRVLYGGSDVVRPGRATTTVQILP